ncbi:hypothetical protein P153DRAFT_385956 [Dothidotthia symphoricarpi CBS 119687]|uniref:Uncharacterized protein n=1 Tax=Dothidotthia symphoricarpi CBS 119687 TaxID=1392245 RepID=A0A6A6ACV8_9PLEO|nr:uncharacterized protein P153DRAFT_385956 [Dothidotthia symphoricarpi CBS 119687]KAF2128748.1 hypothetical protein P153DRAFT_385956 [Dothidotthia symphoricarpi CBS 119687]
MARRLEILRSSGEVVEKVRDIRFLLNFITTSENVYQQSFYVPHWIAKRSPYLCSLIPYTSAGLEGLCIELHNICPMAFGVYVEWLHLNQITPICADAVAFRSPVPQISTLLFGDCMTLIRAHMLGSKFQHAHFQDHIIDQMTRILDPSQTPNVEILTVVFGEEIVSKELRSFVIDNMFAAERRMLAMLRGNAEDMRRGSSANPSCDYHIHEGGRCYRDVPWPQVYQDENMRHVSLYSNTLSSRKAAFSQNLGHEDTTILENIPSSPMDNTSFYLMPKPNSNPSGDMRWPRIAHRPGQREKVPPELVNKPLPPLPDQPIKPTHLLFAPYFQSITYHHTPETITTQDIVHECLNRLPTKSSDTPPPVVDHEEDYEFPIFSESICSLQTPEPSNLSHEPPKMISSTGSTKRKPVPPRGEDWIEQYNCVNELNMTLSSDSTRK